VVRIHTDECVQYHFQIPADPSSWPDRLEAACRYLESHAALPRAPLAFGLKSRDSSQFEIEDRRAYFARSLRSRYRDFCVVNGRKRRAHGFDVVDDGAVIVRSSNPQPPDIFGLLVQVPTFPVARRLEVLVDLGDILEAYSGFHLSQAAWWLLHARAGELSRKKSGAPEPEVLRPFRELLECEGIELPVLETNHGKFESPLQPELAGWLNSWSDPVAQYLGFSGELRGQALAQVSRSTQGSWVVQLTPEPLHLLDPAQLRLYAELHRQLPRLGIRQ